MKAGALRQFARRLADAIHRMKSAARRDRGYRYFKCAGCGRLLREPKGMQTRLCRCCARRAKKN